jgi:AMIN domain
VFNQPLQTLIESAKASIFMFCIFRSTNALVLWAVLSIAGPFPLYAQAVHTQEVPSIRDVQVLRGGNQVEIQIESSSPIVPQTNELGGPNRLLIDFVNARPGAQLRALKVDRAEVKGLRVSLFTADPPVTRIVVDLSSPQPYQVFPEGKTTIVKIGGSGAEIAGAQAALGNIAAANEAGFETPPDPPKPTLEVGFHNGLLSIDSNRANLSEVLFAVHQRTGAEIAIPAGAEQEQVVVNLGPAPAPEVLSRLLNGSKFNFVILSSPKNPAALDQVILSPRAEAPMQVETVAPQPPPPQPQVDNANNADDAPNEKFRMRGRPGGVLPHDQNPTTDGEVQPDAPAADPQ